MSAVEHIDVLGEHPLLIDSSTGLPRLLLRVKEVAAVCGMPLSTVYDLIGREVLPSIRRGRSIRVPTAGLLAAVRAWEEEAA